MRQLIELKDVDFISFEHKSNRFGRAEFQICTQFKDGGINKISIYPMQQEDTSKYYGWEDEESLVPSLSLQGYQGLDYPDVYDIRWCIDHQCQTMSLYVPIGSKFLWFEVLYSTINIGFIKNKNTI